MWEKYYTHIICKTPDGSSEFIHVNTHCTIIVFNGEIKQKKIFKNNSIIQNLFEINLNVYFIRLHQNRPMCAHRYMYIDVHLV